MKPATKIRLCLAASGGGHVRQILDLEPLWKDYPYLFVTEDTALGRSIAEKHPGAFVAHVALGQARLGAPFAMLWNAARNALQSLQIVRKHKPDVVITTGAGSMFFTVLWARLAGARIVLVDSFARFDHPSAFARIAGPLAHVRIAQAEGSARHWPGAVMFDPFRILDTPRPPKKKLLFATVGATLKFERLVNLMPAADQKELMQLLLNKVEVRPFDPERDGLPDGSSGAFATKVRSKWYRVSVSLQQLPGLGLGKRHSGGSSDYRGKWLPDLDSNQEHRG